MSEVGHNAKQYSKSLATDSNRGPRLASLFDDITCKGTVAIVRGSMIQLQAWG